MQLSTRQDPLVIPSFDTDKPITHAERAYQRLRKGIMVGSIEPGVAVTIRGLAAALSISHTPVREALGRLVAEGALVMRENRRVMTPLMTLGRFKELLALRIQLETHAALRAWPYINDALVEQMLAVDLALDAARNQECHVDSVLLNHAFHRLLHEANPHTVVMPMLESVWLQLGPFTHLATLQTGQRYVIDRHKEVVAALGRRDKVAFIEAIEADIGDAVAHLTDQRLQALMPSA